MFKISVTLYPILWLILMPHTVFCAPVLGTSIGSVVVKSPEWDEAGKIVILISKQLQAATNQLEFQTKNDLESEQREFTVSFSFTGSNKGHVQAKFFKMNSRTGTIAPVVSTTETLLGKPYAFVVYNRNTDVPDLSRLLGVCKTTANWDVVMLDYIPISDDASDVDLEYTRQTDYVDFVNSRRWIKEILGPASYLFEIE